MLWVCCFSLGEKENEMAFATPPHVLGLTCLVCGGNVAYGNVYTCPRCGVEGILDVQYDYDACRSLFRTRLSSPPTDHWRYRELMPVPIHQQVPVLQIGWTPVYNVPRLASSLGVRRMLLKDDGRNPTNSFKDRASSVGVLKAEEFGFKTIACASTGNAASSLAGLSAATGLSSMIFVPERAPEPKIVQLLVFGATVLKVHGSYTDAFELCRLACDEFGWYNRNSGTNPFLVEGKKTAGLEIAEQCRERIPDWVAVSVGDGCTIGAVGKGLQEMKVLGLIDHVPRLLGVQAQGAMPVVEAFRSRANLVPVDATTIADSIAVGTPRNWRRAIQQVRLSGGDMVAVADEDILDAMRMTARLGGVFGEPAGVAGIAGVKEAVARGIIAPDESVLALITGNGLKDIHSAKRAVGHTFDVEPDLRSLQKIIAAGHSSGGAPT